MKAVFDARSFASMTFNNYLLTKDVPNVSFLKDATASDDRIKALFYVNVKLLPELTRKKSTSVKASQVQHT